MSSFSPPVQRLVTELGKLPGIGGRTAQRLAFHILRASQEDALALADERRDPAIVCVVEEPSDIIPVERTHEFHGRYHVLGGALSPIDGVDPDDLKIAELLERLRDGSVREVVIATNPTTTGEATALHIAAAARQVAPEVSVTRLASGLPVGADLEYADEL